MRIQKDIPLLVSRFLISCLYLIVITACSTVPTATPTLEPTVIPTDSPTITPSPEPEEITFEVIFDENHECTVLGPNMVSVGKYLFALDDQSDQNLGLWVVQFHEGKTYQDLLDLQSEPGEYIEQPLWTTHPFYFTKDHEVWTVNLDEAGEHAIVLGSYAPKSVWLCYAFQVIEPPPE